MHMSNILGSGHEPAASLAAAPQQGTRDKSDRELVLALLVTLGALFAAGLLAPLGLGALWVAALALAMLAFSFGRWFRLHRRIRSIAREWQLTIDAVDSPIFTLDLEGRILRMNRAAMVLSGEPYSESLGKRIEELGSGEPWRTLGARVALTRSGEPSGAAKVEDAGGESWEITVPAIRDPGGARPTIVAVARNVSELVALQESLHRQELTAAMGATVAGVAHDMRNYLSAITGTVHMLETGPGDREDLDPLLRVLRKNGDRMSDLMQTLLDYGKPVELSRDPQALAEVIEEARQICVGPAVERGVDVRVLRGDPLPPIQLDRTRMLQALKNLLENAVQHSPPGGRVEVEARLVGGWIDCRVRDSGPGFDAADLGRLFEPFFSRRHGGTGLGLAIVQRVVDEHGGEIEVANHAGGGGEVRVRLPVKAGA